MYSNIFFIITAILNEHLAYYVYFEMSMRN